MQDRATALINQFFGVTSNLTKGLALLKEIEIILCDQETDFRAAKEEMDGMEEFRDFTGNQHKRRALRMHLASCGRRDCTCHIAVAHLKMHPEYDPVGSIRVIGDARNDTG